MSLNWQVLVTYKLLGIDSFSAVSTVAAFDDRQEALDWMAGRDYSKHNYTLTYEED